jgi:hypothetical protein
VHGVGHPHDELVDVDLQEREVQLQLAGKVLVENRLGHPGTFGDLVHRRGVVPVRGEDVLSGGQQLRPARGARQTYRPVGLPRQPVLDRFRHTPLQIPRRSGLPTCGPTLLVGNAYPGESCKLDG